jgi:salicylate 5-hydroxylase small subunit
MDFSTYFAIQNLLLKSASILDGAELSNWPDLFTADGSYKLQSRENYDRGLPLCVVDLESQGMLRDRIEAVQDTIYHDPYSQCHVCGAPSIEVLEEIGHYAVQSSFILTRVQHGKMPETLAVGRYVDVIVQASVGYQFKSRLAVFDNNLIPNSIIKPV